MGTTHQGVNKKDRGLCSAGLQCMAYQQAERYLNSLVNYEKNTSYLYPQTFKLARIRDFLAQLGDPQGSLRIIHVAGSKGKGSTCVFAAYMLREAGFRVGLYTSPHLNNFRERIRILEPISVRLPAGGVFEGMISERALAELAAELKPRINKFNRGSKCGPLSFFEVYTALAFLYFQRKKIDFAVLETGMGGRLDATNAAVSLVCGISPLSLEHVDKLGNTLAKIAAQKAGIIKRKGAIVISASQDKAARRVIRARCKKFGARLYAVGRQIKYFTSKKGLTIKGLKGDYRNLSLNLIGEHQAANAALAVGIVESLGVYGFNLKSRAIRRGLAQALWPGRCEVVGKNPLIVLDGAQNVASAQVLRKTIRDNFGAGKYRKLILVLGISADKDIAGMCRKLQTLADTIILTRAATVRAAPPERLAGYFKRKLYLTQSVKEARLLAGSLAGKKDLILVTGSLFVVGEYRDVGK
jgi:dihydrofolate synthase / folylpolyglutamate synthase